MEPCEKRGFGTEHRARQSVQTMGKKVFVYRCRDCHEFHVTTQPRELNKKRKPNG